MVEILSKEQVEKELEETETKKEKKVTKKNPPMGYIPIRLDSLGKLDAPEVLHFRDFSFSEALDLADSTLEENNNIKKVIACLNEMVWEGFDCNYLHLNDLYEILFTLQSNFYDPFIEKEIYIDESLPADEIDEPINVIRATIPLSAIDTQTIDENFKEPFIIKDDRSKIEITTRISRIKDMVDADNYWKKNNIKTIRDYSDVENAMVRISMKKSIKEKEKAYSEFAVDNYERVMEYQQIMSKRIKQTAVLAQGLCLVKFGSKKIDTIEDVLEVMPHIPKRLWDMYAKETDKYKFGLVNEVTFNCPELNNKEITRRFSFRPVDFFQNTE
jgi:hypothetical protein